MTVVLEIRPEVEERLAERARSRGLTLENYIESLLEQEAGGGAAGGEKPLSGPEKAALFSEFVATFPQSKKVLTIEDVSRESFYERD